MSSEVVPGEIELALLDSGSHIAVAGQVGLFVKAVRGGQRSVIFCADQAIFMATVSAVMGPGVGKKTAIDGRVEKSAAASGSLTPWPLGAACGSK